MKTDLDEKRAVVQA